MTISKTKTAFFYASAAFALVSSQASWSQMAVAPAPQGQPGIPFSGAPADPDNQAVVDALMKTLKLRPYHTLDPAAARQQPTFTDGVHSVLRAQGRPTTPPPVRRSEILACLEQPVLSTCW